MEQIHLDHPLGLLDMSNEEYHAAPGTSSSHIKEIIDKSLLHFWHKHINPDREPEPRKKHFDFGTAAHAAILEPDRIGEVCAVSPPFNLRSPTGRAERDKFAEENPDRAILLPDEYQAVLAIRDRVHTHPVVSGLLTGGRAEQTFFAIDPETGELIKCRPDYLHDNGFAMLDVKTTADASQHEFGRHSGNLAYDISVPWYFDVLKALYGETPKHFIFLAIEKDPPYAMGLYYAQPHDIERARIAARRHFLRIVEAKRTNYWPDYASEVLPLVLPGWVKR